MILRLRHALYRFRHRWACALCDSGRYVHTPLTNDPSHHLRIIRPWKDCR